MKLYWRYKKDGKWTWKSANHDYIEDGGMDGRIRVEVDDPMEGEE
jgi:hypothetical protein